ncbi:MAG TPA: hypothetical protein VFM46_19535 [Pseudomonadales bacterium]|nr:hypothetical protein [Pseudomonadales bacterium]
MMAALCAAIVVLTGCEKAGNKKADQALSLDCGVFATSVNPIFDTPINTSKGVVTCSASGCHRLNDGAGGNFRITPNAQPGSAEMERNYISATAFVNTVDPASSPLIQEPLTGSYPTVGGHGGGDIINEGDQYYNALYQWIANPTGNANCTSAISAQLKVALDETSFADKINPLFDKVYASNQGEKSCASAGCHLQGQTQVPHFKLFAHAQPGTAEMHLNFMNTLAMINRLDPEASPLLTEITIDSGYDHGGGALITKGDTTYLTLYQWVVGP